MNKVEPSRQGSLNLDQPAGVGPLQTLRSFGPSLVINGIVPYLIYTTLESRFTTDSIQPLVYASVFPALALIIGALRTRVVDLIPVFVLLGMAANIAAIFLTPSVQWALVARSLNEIVIAGVLAFSTLIGKPVFYYIARQFVTANDRSVVIAFDKANAVDGKRTFFIVTLVWAVGFSLISALNVSLALSSQPSDYLLISQLTSIGIISGLIAWTVRFAHTRLTKAAGGSNSKIAMNSLPR